MSTSHDHSEEEGQVKSPDNMDSDEGTGDSLDIKPPQAKSEYRSTKLKKHKRHSEKKDKYYERDDRREYRDRYDEKDYYIKDYVSKRDPREYEKSRSKHAQQQQQQQGTRTSRRNSQEEKAYDIDRREEDLRNRLIRRRQQGDAPSTSSSGGGGGGGMRRDDGYKHHRQVHHRQIDSEAEARRKKFLDADRDERKRKERARQELEARREQHSRSKEVASTSRDVSLSPDRKKKRYSSSEERQAAAVEIVSSDHAEDELDSDSDSSKSKGEESEEFEISPIDQLEKSDHSKSASSSRSRSRDTRSRSPSKSRSRSLSESSTGSSLSRSPTNSKSSESESEHSDHDESKKEASPKPADDVVAKETEEATKAEEDAKKEEEEKLPPYFPALQGCRSVEEFQCLNRIEEGTYGVVYRAKDKRTNEIVALKRLKMEKEKEGFPITSLREINTLLKGQHSNIVTVREIVVGSNMDKIFIVMDYVEHDLKSLMETMKHKKQKFLPAEVKCLIQQLMRAVAHLHDNWILHRDLKTSNLLLSHKGILKVGDFGLAREYGSPLKEYTSIVVTLWYRAPELLLGCKEYSTPIDVWSCGCIFAELLAMSALFPGKSEVDQLNRIFKDLGTPNERVWPGYDQLPLVKKMTFTDYPVSQLRKKFANLTSEMGLSLLQGLLTYDPKQRLSADASLKSIYFKEFPLPIDPSMFPT